jgi:hypothetical protein
MKTPDTSTLTIPLEAVTNPAFPHDARLERARAFLAARGIMSRAPGLRHQRAASHVERSSRVYARRASRLQ